jgi:DNA-binding transcriptional LysR family regulator
MVFTRRESIGVLGGLTLRLSGRRLGIKALPIDLPVWPRPVAIVMLKNRTVSPVVELFIEHARASTASLTKRKP